jgi:hypothetical protein
MRVRIVHVTLRRSGARARREEWLDGPSLSIGRSTINSLQIPGLTVPLRHSVIRPVALEMRLEAVGSGDLLVNGHSVPSGRSLAIGDAVRVGEFELRIVEPAPGENLALEVEQVEIPGSEREELAKRTVIGINRGLLTRRKLSWGLTLLIAATLFGVPLAGRRLDVGSDTTERSPALRLSRKLESAWSSGPLARPHAHLADRCTACHARPFRLVADEECLRCHGDVARHAPRAMQLESLAVARCASCHEEHRGAQLIPVGDRLCATCHGDLKARLPRTRLLDAADFHDRHPELRPSVVTRLGSAERERLPVRAAGTAASGTNEDLREQSGLRFPHSKHLAPKLRSPSGPVSLSCQNCHLPDPTGAVMSPIAFERHCQACHPLAFDETAPHEQAPHTSVAGVRKAVLEYFSARALQQGAPAGGPANRRRPGKSEEQKRLEALAWATRSAKAAEQRLFGAKGPCANCHFFREGVEEIEVVPVLVVPLLQPGRVQEGAPSALQPLPEAEDVLQRWMPLARFHHGPHRTLECSRCHSVKDADSSEAVRLPGIATCRECHGGGSRAPGKLLSDCIMCHAFHLERYGPMRAAEAEERSAPETNPTE